MKVRGRLDSLFHALANPHVVRGGVVGPDVLGAGVFVEGVADGEVALGDDGAADATLVTLVFGRLMDDGVLGVLERRLAVADTAPPT